MTFSKKFQFPFLLVKNYFKSFDILIMREKKKFRQLNFKIQEGATVFSCLPLFVGANAAPFYKDIPPPLPQITQAVLNLFSIFDVW